MKSTFFSKDTGYDKFMKTMKSSSGTDSVFVGYLRSSKPYVNESGEPISMAQLAAVHEFGTAEIPERSFMRSTMAEKERELLNLTKKFLVQIINGDTNKKTALRTMGAFIARAFKNKIQTGPFAPDKPETTKRKGSDKPLIDTGQLRDSIEYELRKPGK